jgi:hypothetical protein
MPLGVFGVIGTSWQPSAPSGREGSGGREGVGNGRKLGTGTAVGTRIAPEGRSEGVGASVGLSEGLSTFPLFSGRRDAMRLGTGAVAVDVGEPAGKGSICSGGKIE